MITNETKGFTTMRSTHPLEARSCIDLAQRVVVRESALQTTKHVEGRGAFGGESPASASDSGGNDDCTERRALWCQHQESAGGREELNLHGDGEE